MKTPNLILLFVQEGDISPLEDGEVDPDLPPLEVEDCDTETTASDESGDGDGVSGGGEGESGPSDPIPIQDSVPVRDEKERLRQFWKRYVVPKSALPSTLPSQGDSSKDGDGDIRSQTGSDGDDGQNDSDDEDRSSVSSEFERFMLEIDPKWSGEKPWMVTIGGRSFQCVPRHLQPPTPDLQTCWGLDYMSDDDDVEEPGPPPHAEFEVSEFESESDEGSPESPLEPVNPKALDLPLCAKFGMGHICQGVDCRACRRAMHGYDTPDGPIPTDPGFTLADAYQTKFDTKRKPESSAPSMLTLKTPPSKRPNFFGSAVVDTPEKDYEQKSGDEIEAGPFVVIAIILEGALFKLRMVEENRIGTIAQ